MLWICILFAPKHKCATLGLGISSQLLASFSQSPILNHFHPPELAAVYLLILIWQGNHCSYIDLQQIILCSARRMRSTSSTPDASGILSGGCGIGVLVPVRRLWGKAIYAQPILCWWSNCILGMQVFKRFSINCAANSGSLSRSWRAQTLYDAVNSILDFIYIEINFTWHIVSLHTLQPTHTATLPISCPAEWDFLNKVINQIFIISYNQVFYFVESTYTHLYNKHLHSLWKFF